MPWNETDIAFKKLNNKRVTTNLGKGINEERGAKTINVSADEIWTDSVPGVPPGSTTSVIEVYDYADRLTLIEDLSVPNQQAWFATTITNTVTANNGTTLSESSRLMDWVSDKYDAPGTAPGLGYEIKVYDKDDILIPKGDASQWYFDYQTGILIFRNASTDSGSVSSRAPFKIVGYRYIGNKGAGTVSSIGGSNGIITDLISNAPITSSGNLQLDVAYSPSWSSRHTFSYNPTSGVSTNHILSITGAPFGQSSGAAIEIGATSAFDGSTAGFFNGSSSGTYIAINAASSYTGDFLNFGLAAGAGYSERLKISGQGVLSLLNPGGASGPQIFFGNASAPSSPSNGDLWYTGSALNFRSSGTIYNLIGSTIGDPLSGGTVGSVIFVGSGNTLSQDNANLFWDVSNNRLGLGNATPQMPLDVRTGASSIIRALNTTSSGLNEGSVISLHQGDVGLIVNGNRLGGIMMGGADGANYSSQHNAAAIQAFAGQTWSFGSSEGSYLTFETTPLGSASRVERMRIDAGPIIWFGNGAASASPISTTISATSGLGTNIGGANLTIRSGSGTGTGQSGDIVFQTATPGGSGSGANAHSDRFVISSHGDITIYGNTGNILWHADTSKLIIDGDGYSDHVSIKQGGVTSIQLGHSSLSGLLGGRIYGSGEEAGGLEISSVSSIQLLSGVDHGIDIYPPGVGAGETGQLRFRELDANGSNFISFKSPDAIANNVTYVLPSAHPSTNQVLTASSISGSGPYEVVLSWGTPSGGGITSLNGQTGGTQTFANDTNVTISSSSNTHTLGWTGQLAVSRGGTGAGTFTSNGVLLGSGTSAITATAAGTSNQVLRVPGAGGAPAFGAIDISSTAAVTGSLAVTNGGTGTGTAFTENNVVFAGSSGVYSQSNAFAFTSSTGQLALSTTGAAAGVLIGGDVQLYRSGANILGIPDIVEIRSANELRFNNSADTKFTSFVPGSQTVTINYTLPASAPSLNDVLKATSVSGTDPVTVALGWAADTDTGITSLNSQTGNTQTFANDTNVTITSGSNTHTLGWSGQLSVGRGGSGAGTFTSNGVLLGNGASPFNVTAAGTANQVLRIPGAGGAPVFGAIDLAQAAAVTGTLAVGNGGTGTGTAFTAGSVVFAGSGGTYSQDNANLFWDDTNDRLGIRTNTPGATLHINPSTGSQASWLQEGAFFRVQAGTRTNNSTATSGTATWAVFNSFAQPTLAATNTGVTTTNAATVFIANSPAAGANMTITNRYALWVDAGWSRFNGSVGLGLVPDDNNMLFSFITTSSNLTRRAIQGLNSVTGSITSTFPVGISGRIEINAAANTISYAAGLFGSARTLSGQSGTITALYGMDFDVWHQGTANIGTMAASRAFATLTNTSNGTITDWIGYSAQLNTSVGGSASATNALGYDTIFSLSGSGTIANLTGYRIQNPSGSQTITNLYGIRIADLTRGTNNFGIYFDGTSGLARQGIWWNADTNLYRSAANTLRTDDELVVGQRATSGVVVLTDGANISLDASLGNHFRVTLGGNRTLLAPTNPVDGQKITIEVIQDGGGNRTLTLTTGSSGSFIFGTDITGITLTTTGGLRDLIGCVYSSSLSRWMVVSFVKGF